VHSRSAVDVLGDVNQLMGECGYADALPFAHEAGSSGDPSSERGRAGAGGGDEAGERLANPGQVDGVADQRSKCGPRAELQWSGEGASGLEVAVAAGVGDVEAICGLTAAEYLAGSGGIEAGGGKIAKEGWASGERGARLTVVIGLADR
jgi:hypothetical protein